MRISRVVHGFVHLGHRDRVRFLAAWSLLALSRLAILLLPFRLVGRALGEHRDPRSEASTAVLDDKTLLRAARIGATVRLAARHTPWRSECFPQALTARILLGLARVPHVVSFGVRRDGDALVAHAWVHVGGGMVTGATGHAYTEVGSFAWAPRARRSG